MNQKLVTCNKCGWVYMQVSRKFAEAEVKSANNYLSTLSQKDRDDYYGGAAASLAPYLKCWCKNSYKNFRDSKPGDCPDGVTLSSMIDRND